MIVYIVTLVTNSTYWISTLYGNTSRVCRSPEEAERNTDYYVGGDWKAKAFVLERAS